MLPDSEVYSAWVALIVNPPYLEKQKLFLPAANAMPGGSSGGIVVLQSDRI